MLAVYKQKCYTCNSISRKFMNEGKKKLYLGLNLFTVIKLKDGNYHLHINFLHLLRSGNVIGVLVRCI